jgi:superfamily II RNA helicase
MASLWRWEQEGTHNAEQNVHLAVHQTCTVGLSQLITWGFVEAGTLTLTNKGVVAAGLRATEHPHLLVELLLAQNFSDEKGNRNQRHGQNLPQSTICRYIAALVVGGRTRLNIKRLHGLSISASGGHVKAILEASEAYASSDALLQATEMWACGQSLLRIWDHQNVAPGTFAKHIVRTADLLDEAAVAFHEWTPTLAESLRLAGEPLRRGLPFLALASS